MELKIVVDVMVRIFFITVPAVVLLVTAIGLIYQDMSFRIYETYRIVLVPFLSLMPTLLYVHRVKISKTEWVLRRGAHAVLTFGVAFLMLWHYGWLLPRIQWILLGFFLVAYIGGNVFLFLRTQALARKLTRQIHRLNHGVYGGEEIE